MYCGHSHPITFWYSPFFSSEPFLLIHSHPNDYTIRVVPSNRPTQIGFMGTSSIHGGKLECFSLALVSISAVGPQLQ